MGQNLVYMDLVTFLRLGKDLEGIENCEPLPWKRPWHMLIDGYLVQILRCFLMITNTIVEIQKGGTF